MKCGGLFAGGGALDLAVHEALGAVPAWFVENDPDATRVLAHHWPHVPNLGDITQIDWTTLETVDVLTAGFPCQPISAAGRQKGTDDERWLWPHVVNAIRALRPRLVVLENVPNLFNLGFDLVIGDLHLAGYNARWVVVRASDVGGCHERARVFILAAPREEGSLGVVPVGWPVAEYQGDRWWSPNTGLFGGVEFGDRFPRCGEMLEGKMYATAAPTWGAVQELALMPTPEARDGDRRTVGSTEVAVRRFAQGKRNLDDAIALLPTVTASDRFGAGVHGDGGLDLRTAVQLLPTPMASGTGRGSWSGGEGESGRPLHEVVHQLLPTPRASDAAKGGPNQRGSSGDLMLPSAVRQLPPATSGTDWGIYTRAVERWERITGRPAPAPTVTGKRGGQILSGRLTEWMMGWPAGWVSDVVGNPAAVKISGNGIVPQQAVAALGFLLSTSVDCGRVRV